MRLACKNGADKSVRRKIVQLDSRSRAGRLLPIGTFWLLLQRSTGLQSESRVPQGSVTLFPLPFPSRNSEGVSCTCRKTPTPCWKEEAREIKRETSLRFDQEYTQGSRAQNASYSEHGAEG
ncbi:hypothetical protein CEXT_252761 [Caerostris extrusa]|uniref:Uncharacterized protein n=1 Tax=Caerostris extrusa TaxID=172846 RepID=A0AAV4MWB5_CAEEX|nr:hypothetical protein CEXT_252761 [Caerostris extrusa]